MSRRKRHVVTEVVAAFGKPLERRGGMLINGVEGPGGEGRRGGLVGMEELVREREERREVKRVRREGRRRGGVGGLVDGGDGGGEGGAREGEGVDVVY